MFSPSCLVFGSAGCNHAVTVLVKPSRLLTDGPTHVELEGVLELCQGHPVVKNRDILPLLHRGRGLLSDNNNNNNNNDNDKPSVTLSVDHTFPPSTKACPIILITAGAKIATLISSSHELLALNPGQV